MTIIYVTENNTKCYGVTSQNKGLVRVQKLRGVSEDKYIIYKADAMEIFLGKIESCEMTEFSVAFDKSVFDGNTVLLKTGKENNKHRYVYIGGDMICSFLTNDRIYKYISNMGNDLTPYSIATGWENIYYLTPYFKITKKANIDENDIDELFDYHNILNCKNYEYIKFIQIMINK